MNHHRQIARLTSSYPASMTDVFAQLCGDRPATLLLESAEIDSKQQLKSLLVIDSALRITALGQQVMVEALTDNGAALLPLLDNQLASSIGKQVLAQGRCYQLPVIDNLQDEESRLQAPSVLDVLRGLLALLKVASIDDHEVPLLAGLFAYDLVATFEALPALADQQGCPDFCFYLAETVLVVDHCQQSAYFQANIFMDSQQAALQQRLQQLAALLQQPAAPSLAQKIGHHYR